MPPTPPKQEPSESSLLPQGWTRANFIPKFYGGSVNVVALSHDNKYLAAATEENGVCVWNINTGEELMALNEMAACKGMCWQNSANVLYYSRGNNIARWDLEKSATPTHILLTPFVDNTIYNMAMAPDDSYLLLSTFKELYKYSAYSANSANSADGTMESTKLVVAATYIPSICCSPDSKIITAVCAYQQGGPTYVSMWDATSLKQVYKGGENRLDRLHEVAWNHEGTQYATVSEAITIWAWPENRKLRSIHPPIIGYDAFSPRSICWSPDDKMLATGAYGSHVCLVDRQYGPQADNIVYKVGQHRSTVTTIDWRGDMIATGSYDAQIILWAPSAPPYAP